MLLIVPCPQSSSTSTPAQPHPQTPSLACAQRSFRASNNALEAGDITVDLYALEDLSTLDLSSNEIDAIPEQMAMATGLLGQCQVGSLLHLLSPVLVHVRVRVCVSVCLSMCLCMFVNVSVCALLLPFTISLSPLVCFLDSSVSVLDLSHNKLKGIEHKLLTSVTDIEYLDLSHNQLTALPAQIRRSLAFRCLPLLSLRFHTFAQNPFTQPTHQTNKHPHPPPPPAMHFHFCLCLSGCLSVSVCLCVCVCVCLSLCLCTYASFLPPPPSLAAAHSCPGSARCAR